MIYFLLFIILIEGIYLILPISILSYKKVAIHEAGHTLWYIKLISNTNNNYNKKFSNRLLSVYRSKGGGSLIIKGKFDGKYEVLLLASGIAAVRLYEGGKLINIIGVLFNKWFLGGYSDIKHLQNLNLSLKDISQAINDCMNLLSEYDKKFLDTIIDILSSQSYKKNKYSYFICQSIPKKTLYKLSRAYYKNKPEEELKEFIKQFKENK